MMEHLVGHTSTQFATEIDRDEMEHQVKRCRSSRAGETIAINLEKAARYSERGIIFRKGLYLLPMDGSAIAVQQPGIGQNDTAGTHAAQLHTLAGKAPQT